MDGLSKRCFESYSEPNLRKNKRKWEESFFSHIQKKYWATTYTVSFPLFYLINRRECDCRKLASIYPATIRCKNRSSWLFETVWFVCGKICESVTNWFVCWWWNTGDCERCTKRSDKIRNRTSMPLIVELHCDRHCWSFSNFCGVFIFDLLTDSFCFLSLLRSAAANCANLFANHAAHTRKRCKLYWSGTNATATAIRWKN